MLRKRGHGRHLSQIRVCAFGVTLGQCTDERNSFWATPLFCFCFFPYEGGPSPLCENPSADTEAMHVDFPLRVPKWCGSVLIISPERCHLAAGEMCSSCINAKEIIFKHFKTLRTLFREIPFFFFLTHLEESYHSFPRFRNTALRLVEGT